MKRELAQLIADAIDGEVCEDYSGRGMYGRTTCGVVFDGHPGDVCASLINLSGEIEDLKKAGDLDEMVDSLHFDSLGLDTIIY